MGSMFAQIKKEQKEYEEVMTYHIKSCKTCKSRCHFINDKWWCNRCMKEVKEFLMRGENND